MRMSHLFLNTLRDAPSEIATPGLQLLTRAGFVRQTAPGDFAFLPLGVRVRDKLSSLIRQAMRTLEGQEVAFSPSLQADPLQTILGLVGGVVQSYRQLPVTLFHIGSIPASEEHARRGLFGANEALVVDGYHFRAHQTDSNGSHSGVHAVFAKIVRECNLDVITVAGEEDESGEATIHKMVWPWDAGDEKVMVCRACGYAADQPLARTNKTPPPAEPPAPMEEVETPNCKTIAELARFLNVPESRTAKAVFLVAQIGDEDRFIFVIVRGDTDLNEAKLKRLLKAQSIGPATEAEIREVGAEPGYGSPVGLEGITLVADDLIPQSPNLVAGANRPGYHTLNVNYRRDFQATIVADITLARDGDPCPKCGASLALERGIELAWFKNRDRALNITYLDADGHSQPVLLGRYRLYLDHLLAATAEAHHDDYGIIWPPPIAPYHVYLMTLGKRSDEVIAAADQLYADLLAADVDVLYDDRDERAGVKFNDADLLGLPLRVAVGSRGLQEGIVEVKRRADGDKESIPIDEVVTFVVSRK